MDNVVKEKWVTIGIPKECHAKLVARKVHPRQSIHDVIEQLILDASEGEQ